MLGLSVLLALLALVTHACRHTRAAVHCSLWAWGVASCAIFPEQAVLPSPSGDAGDAAISPQQGGKGGAGASTTLAGGANAGGAADTGGSSKGGAGGAAGAEPDPSGGAGSPGGCLGPTSLVVPFGDDTWIESAKPSSQHGTDEVLFVVAGSSERRALLSLALPTLPVGAALVSAYVTLHLESNADVELAARQLELHALTQPVTEGRTTWNNWGNGGMRKWVLPGGDFGPAVASVDVASGTPSAHLSFDVTATVAAILAVPGVPLSLIAIEAGPSPPAPAELAFTSAEGDAVFVPSLSLAYCPP